MAEALLKRQANDMLKVFSAGTKLSGPAQPIGELTPNIDEVLRVMDEIGIDISENLRKQISEDMAESVDKIILVMDDNDLIPDYLNNNPKVTKWNVPDPKGKDLEFTRNVRDQISELVNEFTKEHK